MEDNINSSNGEETTDNARWILWLFYYNPDDKRLLPPKRIPWMGWTVNFANPYSIALNIVIVIGIFLTARFLSGHFHR